MFSLEQELEAFFDNSGGNGVIYGGTGQSGSITGNPTGGSGDGTSYGDGITTDGGVTDGNHETVTDEYGQTWWLYSDGTRLSLDTGILYTVNADGELVPSDDQVLDQTDGNPDYDYWSDPVWLNATPDYYYESTGTSPFYKPYELFYNDGSHWTPFVLGEWDVYGVYRGPTPDPAGAPSEDSGEGGVQKFLLVVQTSETTAVAMEANFGTAGDDTFSGIGFLLGGDGNDTLSGSSGNDVLFGGAGNDVLKGGAGADGINGGDGFDMASYEDAAAGVSVNLATGLEASGDKLYSIEGLLGSSYADAIRGDAGGNMILSGGGNDTIDGGDGGDAIAGGSGDDSLMGGAGNDTVKGEDGNDIVYGGAGADQLEGGAGNDVLSYFDAQGGVTVNLGANTVSGDIAQGDTISGFENASGGAGGDWLYGSNDDNVLDGCGGGDFLIGFGGNDLLLGGDGDDTLIADWGTDILVGGAGRDLFAIWATTQHGIITDFTHGQDHVQLSTSLFANFTALQAAAVQSGNDVVIANGTLDITLKNVQVATLSASDFYFV